MSSTSRDHSGRASTRYRVSSPVTVHVHFQVCSAWLLCGVLLRLPWHSFQVPRHTFQLHHVTSPWFRITRARHLIVSEMSTRSCAKYAQRMLPLRNNVACSPSRIGLFLIASASAALSFTLGVLTCLGEYRSCNLSHSGQSTVLDDFQRVLASNVASLAAAQSRFSTHKSARCHHQSTPNASHIAPSGNSLSGIHQLDAFARARNVYS